MGEENKEGESKNLSNYGIVLNDQDEVLLIRRVREDTGSDGSVLRWAFPGGKQRFSESREECVKREVLAETGYDVKPQRQISMRMHPQFGRVIVYHYCTLNSPKPIAGISEPEEIAEAAWVKLEELKTLITTNIDPKVAEFLRI